MAEEIVDIVNENDEVIGQKGKDEVHQDGSWHRAAHVWVFNSKGELFMQKRSRDKLLVPSHWDSSAAGHVDSGEDYETAAARELWEELGIKGVELERLVKRTFVDKVKGKYYNREFIQLFRCVYDGEVNFDERESEEGGFYSVDEIAKEMKQGSRKFVPVFVEFIDWHLKERENAH